MGVVWRAIDERLERSVAVKQILAQPGLSEAERINSRQRAMREAKNAARFQHPNAIVVFDIAQHDGDPCLIMEYLPSRSLAAVLAENPTLPLPQVARIGEQVAAALVAAHRAGIVHRDVKPGNILIDDAGTTKITDFGISRAAGDLTLTQTGLIGGTPAYLAPELARGADPSPGSDVFALGATLYHALEGVAPYGNSTNQLALLYKAANGKVEPPRKSGAATALLMSMLQVEPEERPSMPEARERLAALARGEGDTRAAAVSPALGVAGGGRQPATPAGGNPVSRTPWARTDKAPGVPAAVPVAAPKPVNPTSSFPPQRPAAAPQQTAAAPQQAPAAPPALSSGRTPAQQSEAKRKALMLGAGGAAVLVVAVVVLIVLSTSGDDGSGDTAQGAPPPTSQSQAPAESSAPPSSAKPSQQNTTSSGKVEWGPAGQKVIDFYNLPGGAAASWAMLTPAGQADYGSAAAFEQYWQQFKSVSSKGATAYKRANNEDGSVDIKVTVSHSGGSVEKVVRVVAVNGQLYVDTNTKLDGAAPQQ
ncbi:serine/threonine-protein kinase [Amycolatopsis albispora]|uniref:non-specific serine/threonine protein kinase n=1 Tax=Amycolatopsis albispora TaxID=1804986 RepID=A0A344LK97_9PSEU|nr:serine/threonine-protein kinase [Amycolatopsis albispora]AXB48471.1 serine/threonine protein kinase [Amycolatopsis albispora]